VQDRSRASKVGQKEEKGEIPNGKEGSKETFNKAKETGQSFKGGTAEERFFYKVVAEEWV
jgi:hypothetical protein